MRKLAALLAFLTGALFLLPSVFIPMPTHLRIECGIFGVMLLRVGVMWWQNKNGAKYFRWF